MANGKNPIIKATDLILPDAEALVRHGGMSLDAASLVTGKRPVHRFDTRVVDVNAQFRGAVLIGGAGETAEVHHDIGLLPPTTRIRGVVIGGAANETTDILGTPPPASSTAYPFVVGPVFKAATGGIEIPTTEQVEALRTGAPVIVTKREPGG